MPQDKEVPTTRANKAREEVLTQDCGKKTDELGWFSSRMTIYQKLKKLFRNLKGIKSCQKKI